MTLFDVALKNIRRNSKDYALYIGSIVFSILIYFTFVSLKYSEDLTSFTSMKKQLQSMMNASSIVLLLFVAVFIFYSNTFFLKKRKKEVGLYSLIGVRKKQIGFLLFFENMVIGCVSLIIGILAGFFLSKFFVSILMKLMGYEAMASFQLSFEAIVHTTIVFFILFLITSFQGYRVIYQFKLIELFHANKKGEAEPKAKGFAVLFSLLFLTMAYYLASVNMFTSKAWEIIGILATPLLVIVMTIIGTYLFFQSVSVYGLKALKAKEKIAWNGLHLITLSQLLYRVKANAKTLTMIAILSATTITAGGAVFSLYYNTEKDMRAAYPNTMMYKGEAVSIPQEIVVYDEQLHTKMIELPFSQMTTYEVIARSEYNKIAQLQKKRLLSMEENEAILIEPFKDLLQTEDYTNETFSFGEEELIIKEVVEDQIYNSYTMFVAMVVTDQQYARLVEEEQLYQLVSLKDEKNQLPLIEEVASKLTEDQHFSSFTINYKQGLESLGMLLFVGSFLGLVFLVATGSIIYFKMITEAEEDRDKYMILHKIGVNEKEMTKSIRHQIAFIFVLPLIIGLVHAGFALKAFSTLFMMNLWQPVLYWMIFYTVIYMIYYVLTVRYYKNTIRQTRGT